MSRFCIARRHRITQINFSAFLLTTLLALPVPAQPRPDTDIRPLTVGQLLEGELKSGEKHEFSIALKSGNFARFEVEQTGIDPVISLIGPDGKQLAEMDGSDGRLWYTTLSTIARQDGKYRVEISRRFTSEKPGSYRLRLFELRPSADTDRIVSAAEVLLSRIRSAIVRNEFGSSVRTDCTEAVAKFSSINEPRLEAITLFNLAVVLFSLNQYSEGIVPLRRAADLFRATRDLRGEAKILNILGLFHSRMGQFSETEFYYKAAVDATRKTGNPRDLGLVLVNLGHFYRMRGDGPLAEPLFLEALTLAELERDSRAKIAALDGIGDVYLQKNNYERALESYNEGLAISRSIGDTRQEGALLLDLGITYQLFLDVGKAVEFLDQSLAIHRVRRDPYMESYTLRFLGLATYKLGRYQDAQKIYEELLKLMRSTRDKQGESRVLVDLAQTYERMRQYEKALELLQQAQEIHRLVPDRGIQPYLRMILANVYNGLGRLDKAQEIYEEALVSAREIGLLQDEGTAYWNLMRLHVRARNLSYATVFGKLALRTFQKIRSDSDRLNPQTKKDILRINEGGYRELADILLQQQRRFEAYQVLNSFKDQQSIDVGGISDLGYSFAYTPNESKFLEGFDESLNRVATIQRSVDAAKKSLRTTQQLSATTEGLTEAENELKKAAKQLRDFLEGSKVRFAEPSADSSIPATTDAKSELEAALKGIKELGAGTSVAVYQLVAGDRLHFLIITPDGTNGVSVAITPSELNKKARQFWTLLQSDKHDPTKVGKELYDIVFKPLEKVLPTDTKTILWSLDGNLRYIPMAALYDGERYLVERYNHVNFTRVDKERLTRDISPNWTAVAFGTSKEQTVQILGERIPFSSLPGVAEEMNLLFGGPEKKGGIFDGAVLRDERFTREGMLDELKKKRPVVHIASHFSFRPGDEARSFLLMGDGTPFTLADMKKHTGMFDGVEMLTLSACNTAAQQPDANGREVDAFFELAQRLGANSVMATLWSVADNSTPWLMRAFYKTKLEKKLSKAEALRKAQLSLLKGRADIRPIATRTNMPTVKIELVEDETAAKGFAENTRSEIVQIKKQDAPLYDKKKHPPFAHPFYWSPFVLFGNWR